MYDLFISYKREEQPIARKLKEALQSKGWTIWWDPKLRAGEHFDDAIERALTDAKCVIVMWSKLSVNSRYVKDEATYALNKDKLVPIAIEEVDLPFRFEGIQTEQLINWDGSDNYPGFQKLVADIAYIIGEPPIEAEERERKEQQAKRKTMKIGRLRETHDKQIPKEEQKHEAAAKIIKKSMFVLIPEGNFIMGSKTSPKETNQKYDGKAKWYKRVFGSSSTKLFASEHPQHKVTISKTFYLQSTNVTQNQWELIMGKSFRPFSSNIDGKCPMIDVSWNEVHIFIEILNKMAKTDIYRLPTEAEWEYACRAGTTTDFSFGDCAGKLSEYAWYEDNSNDRAHPVGQKKPNAWGLYDMHGNVSEFVEDDWHFTYSGAPADGSAWVDKNRISYAVLRGGSFRRGASSCRSASRSIVSHNFSMGNNGFRLAKNSVIDS